MKPSPHTAIALALLAATLVAARASENRTPESLVRPLARISDVIDGWKAAQDEKLGDRVVATLDASEYLSRRYRRGRDELDVFAAFYAQQRAGESMHSPKYCLPGGGWEFSEWKKVPVDSSNASVRINQAVIQRPGSKAILFYWYESRNRVVASEYESKLFLVWDGLLGGNSGGSIVRVLLPFRRGAAEDGLSFSRKLIAEMKSCFRPNAGKLTSLRSRQKEYAQPLQM